ncbi:MAG: right-handed parallel beta-helix repeat-containing protein [Chitinispirillaceae bacterium]|jgi:hypothetical protein
MYNLNDPSVLWVSPNAGDNGNGTHENPFGDIQRALADVRPGATIVLMGGVYGRDTTFDISGTVRQPIRIVADRGAEVEIRNACWFFYDVSDCIVSGLTFRDAPYGAVSVIGACARNRFENLRFVNCGTRRATSCTLFFGGSGGTCNVVEGCRFERAAEDGTAARDSTIMSIGLMVSEGDKDGGEPLTDHVFRKNYFVNYDYGILIGTGDAPAGQYSHIVEQNTVERCGTEGILVKCGDTLVRGNVVVRCRNRSITIGAGSGSFIGSNRILDCANGIAVYGDGHTVANNCIVRCGGEAIGVCGASAGTELRAASNIIVENNTCIDNGRNRKNHTARVIGVRIDPGTTSVVRRNLFYGEGIPCAGAGAAVNGTRKTASLIIENISSGQCGTAEGVAAADVAFENGKDDDFTNTSGYGAAGWVLTPDAFDPHGDDIDEADDYRCGHWEIDDTDEERGEPEAETAKSAAEDFEGFMERFYSDKVERTDN